MKLSGSKLKVSKKEGTAFVVDPHGRRYLVASVSDGVPDVVADWFFGHVRSIADDVSVSNPSNCNRSRDYVLRMSSVISQFLSVEQHDNSFVASLPDREVTVFESFVFECRIRVEFRLRSEALSVIFSPTDDRVDEAIRMILEFAFMQVEPGAH